MLMKYILFHQYIEQTLNDKIKSETFLDPVDCITCSQEY